MRDLLEIETDQIARRSTAIPDGCDHLLQLASAQPSE
jgi:hypothetical protein